MGRLDQMKGGGFLNNVDGTWMGLEFTHTFPGGDTDPENIFGVLTVRPDGAEPVQSTLRFGSSQFLTIEDGGRTLRNPEGQTARIWDKSDGYHLLASLDKAGVPDGGLDPTDADVISLNGMVGKRMRFEQEPDTERMDARVKAGKSAKRKDEKTGKEYPFTRLIVSQVYDTPAAVAPTPAKSAGKGATKAAAKTAVKAGGSDVASDSDGEVVSVLKKVLTDNGGAVLRSDLTRLLTTELLQTKNPRREAIRKRAYDPEFLKGVAGVAFDEVGQTIELAG